MDREIFFCFICLIVLLQKQDLSIKGGCSSTFARSSVSQRFTVGLPCHFQINSPSKQRKYCSRSPLSTTYTRSHTISAHEALSTMFWSRFPSLSTHKAWERHKEEADVGARDSLELFWLVKVTEMWQATWAKISSRSSEACASIQLSQTPSTRQWEGGKEDIVSTSW